MHAVIFRQLQKGHQVGAHERLAAGDRHAPSQRQPVQALQDGSPPSSDSSSLDNGDCHLEQEGQRKLHRSVMSTWRYTGRGTSPVRSMACFAT